LKYVNIHLSSRLAHVAHKGWGEWARPQNCLIQCIPQRRISWAFHGLSKVSLRPGMPYHYALRAVITETALQPLQGQPTAGRVAYYPLGYPMPYTSDSLYSRYQLALDYSAEDRMKNGQITPKISQSPSFMVSTCFRNQPFLIVSSGFIRFDSLDT
jgi:hypothetical protein